MIDPLARWNRLTPEKAANEMLPCCGSQAWGRSMAAARPLTDEASLFAACDSAWQELTEADLMEAFSAHPRIGERSSAASEAPSAQWSAQEQRGVANAGEALRVALGEGNRQYEQQFGRVFIVCATGRSAAEILEILRRRLRNDPAMELREAAEQLRQITHIRLKKWLQQ